MFKRMIVNFAVLAAFFCMALKVDAADTQKAEDTWLIYWYICGSNLESGSHYATKDIAEMQQVKLPPNIKVLINAGGTTQWHHPTLKAGGNGIYLYSSNRLEQLVSRTANMGDPATLANFLKYGEENFEADHKIFIFWDHGDLNLLCTDDNFKGDYLSYNEINRAFASVYGNSPETPAFELIGFKACMTASYELANTISDFSHYMVGSEPSVNDWPFKEWIAALANDPSMNGAQIGKSICDNALKNYNADLKLVHTFSVIDLSKMPKLREAYEEYFAEANRRADVEEGFRGKFARAASARNVDKYSGLFADLGLIAKNTKDFMPKTSRKLLKAIDKAVVHNKNGAYIKSKGISTYYPQTSFNNPTISEQSYYFRNFLTQPSASNNRKGLYRKLLDADVSNFQSVPLKLRKDHFVAELTPEQLGEISAIQCVLMPVTEGRDPALGLSGEGIVVTTSSEDLNIDWKKGVISENFRAVQPVFDGHKIAMFASVRGRGHLFYEVPILVNDILVDLYVRYNVSTKKYSIIGFHNPLRDPEIENGMARDVRYSLQPGSVITPVFMTIVPENSVDATADYAMMLDKDDNVIRDANGNVKLMPLPLIPQTDPKTGVTAFVKFTKGEPFVYTRDSAITDKRIPNGEYIYALQFVTPNGSSFTSEPALISVEYGEVTRFDSEDLEDDDE